MACELHTVEWMHLYIATVLCFRNVAFILGKTVMETRLLIQTKCRLVELFIRMTPLATTPSNENIDCPNEHICNLFHLLHPGH